MKLKQTKKKLFIALLIVGVCGALGFLFANNNKSSNALGSNIITYYDTRSAESNGAYLLSSKSKLFADAGINQNRLIAWNIYPRNYNVVEYANNIVGPVSSNSHVKNFVGSDWKDGMIKLANTYMMPVKYLEIDANSTKTYSNTSWEVEVQNGGNTYKTKMSVKELTNASTVHKAAFTVATYSNSISLDQIYSKNCKYLDRTNNIAYSDSSGTQSCDEQNDNDILVPYYYRQEHADGYKGIFTTMEYQIESGPQRVYLNINDIDYGQSYRVKNQNVCNTITKECNIYRDFPEDIFDRNDDPLIGTSGYVNNEKNYIYFDNNNVNIFSSMTVGNTYNDRRLFRSDFENNKEKTSIWLRLADSSGADTRTLEVVYGFRYSARSNINLYAEAYDVKYKAINENNQNVGSVFQYNGTDPVVGDSVDTKIYASETIKLLPTIRTSLQSKYKIGYWTANKDITVGGITFQAGEEISPNNMDTLAQVFSVQEDYTLTAHLVLNKYNITFVDEDGTTIEGPTQYDYGTTVANIAKPADPTKTVVGHTCTFTGWTPTIVDVTADATYKATYNCTVNRHTITFVDEDGTSTIGTPTQYDYDTPAASIVRPADPTKTVVGYTCTFTGWTPTIATVTGDATYTATYNCTKNNYTVTFYAEDVTTVVDSKTYHYGDEVDIPQAPAKESTAQYRYTFASWEPKGSLEYPDLKESTIVIGNAEYYATYNEITRQYPVKFVNYDDKTLLEIEVEYGKTPSYTDDTPTRKDDKCTYKFTGWDKEFTPVTSAQIYKATFEKGECTNVPNTGSGSEKSVVGKVTNNIAALLFAVAGIIGTITTALVIRFFKRRKTMKF